MSAPDPRDAEIARLHRHAAELAQTVEGLEREIAQRRRAEETLLESGLGSGAVIDGVPGLIALMAADGELRFVNRPLAEYFGATVEELKTWATSGWIHDDDRPRVVDIFAASIASGAPFEAEQRMRRSDGAYRWFHARGAPIRDASGRIASWCILLTDIDDRRRAEEALRDNEREARLIVDTIAGGIGIVAPNGEVEAVNRHMLEYFGRPEKELKDWWSGDLVHPDDYPRIVEAYARSIETGEIFDVEQRLRRADGAFRWFHVRGQPLRDAEARIIRWYALHTDIDERKRVESELRETSHLLNEAQRLSKTGCYTNDYVAGVHIWSDELYRMFEFEPGCTITSEAALAAVHPDDRGFFVDAFQQLAEHGTPLDILYRIVTASGRTKHLHTVSHATGWREKRPILVGVVQDITDTRMAEEARDKARSELEHASRAMSLGVLTASIAHEVNQPLSGIITNANVCLRMLSADPPNVEGALETARRTIRDGNRAADVIGRLRALYGKKDLALGAVDLNETTREVVALCARELRTRRIAVVSVYGEDLPRVTGDRIQLQQVILNLLLNASDALSGVDNRLRQISLQTARDGARAVRLTVRDNGVGLPEGSLTRLFEAFYTTKPEGMGIGLSVSRSIIERHHGKLWASRNDGPGAAFSFSVPCSRLAEDSDQSRPEDGGAGAT